MTKFEEFLQERHAAENPGTKDTLIDSFNDWISLLDIDQWLNYGEWFANKTAKEMLERRIKELKVKHDPIIQQFGRRHNDSK